MEREEATNTKTRKPRVELSSYQEMFRNFHDMGNILGNREAVNPKHVLESSSQHVDSSPEIDQDLLEKETLDEEMWAAARAQKERNTPGTSGADGSEDEDKTRTKAEKGRALARAHPVQRVTR